MHLFIPSSGDHTGSDAPGQSTTRFGVWFAGLALIALLAVILWRCVVFVDETEYVYVTQFGQPVRLYVEPGLRWKWPYQSLRRFDRRLRVYEPPAREMLTKDKENLTFAWYVCWRIPSRSFAGAPATAAGPPAASSAADAKSATQQLEPYVRRFLEAVGTMEAAENRLEERIQAALAAEIGRTNMNELVSLNSSPQNLDTITRRVADAVRPSAAEQFGIEIVDVRIKRFNYPEAVKPAVFAEIRSERQRVAVQYRAEGASEKAKIESQATLEREQLLAQARREAATIRGAGEAKAIEIYNAAHSRNPQFYELLKTLETYRGMLDDQTTIVLSADSPLLRLLTQGLPGWSPSATAAPPAARTATGGDSNGPPQPPLHEDRS